jgi:hypothetical protein
MYYWCYGVFDQLVITVASLFPALAAWEVHITNIYLNTIIPFHEVCIHLNIAWYNFVMSNFVARLLFVLALTMKANKQAQYRRNWAAAAQTLRQTMTPHILNVKIVQI